LAVVLSVLFRFTDSDYPFGILNFSRDQKTTTPNELLTFGYSVLLTFGHSVLLVFGDWCKSYFTCRERDTFRGTFYTRGSH